MQFKCCEDFDAAGEWDTDLCCSYCHDNDEQDEDHEMRSENLHGQNIWVCIPLYEQLFNGASHFVKPVKPIQA